MKIFNRYTGELLLEVDSDTLAGAYLQEANLRGADLRGADLRGAYLRYADLRGADLQGADFIDADLRGANLQYADLRSADLQEANLRGANLRDADLRYADLRDADLRGANLSETKLPHFMICPEEGSFIAWKKLSCGVIAKLLIPDEAKRVSSLVGRKCRAEFVKVLGFFNSDKSINTNIAAGVASYRPLSYKIGDTVFPDKFDSDIRVSCTNGIHFFMTFEEARDW